MATFSSTRNRYTKVSNREVPGMVANRDRFDTNNETVRGDWEWYPSYGKLPQEWRVQLASELSGLDEAMYVVYSYSTPIAWWNPSTTQWTVPDTKYSVTTSRHQGLVQRGVSA